MAVKKFLALVNGVMTEIKGVVNSTGTANEGDLVALDAQGKLDASLMPAGVGQNTVTAKASEALAAGDIVNIYDNAGVVSVRKADATGSPTVAAKEAHGFVKEAVASGADATIYTTGNNITGLTGLTVGKSVYLQTTAGASGSVVVAGANNIHQVLGKANSATGFIFEPEEPVKLA